MADITIPISSVQLGDEETRLVLEVLRSGQLAQGPMVADFEARFARECGVAHALAVSSGTTALVASLQALGLHPGDEVVTSPFTFVATVNAILEAGATVRFADIRLDDFCIDPELAAAAITDRTRVLMPVHLYGQPADMDALAPLAAREHLTIVEDAAQALGASVGGRHVGSFGLACFSLYATKNITTGEGGVITTDDDEIADRIRLLRNQGMRRRYEYEVAGHNYRMTDLQAAVGIPQLGRLAQVSAARQANAATLTEGLAGLPGLEVPAVMPGRTHVFHQYTVRVTPDARTTRDGLLEALAERGIGAGVYYPRPVFDYDSYRADPRVCADAAPNAVQASREVLSLPVHPQLSDADLDRVIDTVREVLGPS